MTKELRRLVTISRFPLSTTATGRPVAYHAASFLLCLRIPSKIFSETS